MKNPMKLTQGGTTQDFLKKRDSTHGVAAQASAAFIIKLLRTNYPEIQTSALTTYRLCSMPSACFRNADQAQGSLGVYIKRTIRTIEQGETKKPLITTEEEKNPNIAATIKLVDYVFHSTDIQKEDKLCILRQMLSIAATHPGTKDEKIWNANEAHWSCNSFYDQKTKTIEKVTACPAETLNLVAAALQDKKHFFSADHKTAKEDCKKRCGLLCSVLLKLEKISIELEHQVCSTGRQHELLFLLNHTYLDKARSEHDATPIVLTEDIESFLLGALSTHVRTSLSALDDNKQQALIAAWVLFNNPALNTAPNNEDAPEEEHPLISFLCQSQKPVANSNAAAAAAYPPTAPDTKDLVIYLKDACARIGVNPEEENIKEKINNVASNVAYLEPPHEEKWSSIKFADTLLKIQPYAITSSDLLMRQRNDALIILQNNVRKLLAAITSEDNDAAIALCTLSTRMTNFFQLNEAALHLFKSASFTVFFEEKEREFFDARKDYYALVLVHFRSNIVDITDDFKNKKARFLIAEEALKKEQNIEFVINCFAALGCYGMQHNDFFTRITENAALYLVTDKTLESWYSIHVTQEDSGQQTWSLSPYEINRILLHALAYHPHSWTTAFCQTLKLIVDWLLMPVNPSDSDAFVQTQLKKTHSSYFLLNLQVTLQYLKIVSNPDRQHDDDQQGRMSSVIMMEKIYNGKFYLLRDDNTPGDEVGDNLKNAIAKIDLPIERLKYVMNILGTTQHNDFFMDCLLSELSRKESNILNAETGLWDLLALYPLSGHTENFYVRLIKGILENSVLTQLLYKTDKNGNTPLREICITAAADPNSSTLIDMVKLLAEKDELLPGWEIVFSNKAIPEDSAFYNKISHVFKKLDQTLCAKLFVLLEKCLANNIKTLSDFKVMLSSFPKQYVAVCVKCQDHLQNMMQSVTDFHTVMGTPHTLTQRQRLELFELLKGCLPGIIKTAEDFESALMLLPDLHTMIIEELKCQLPSIIDNGHDFAKIQHRLHPDDRVMMYEALKDNMSTIIANDMTNFSFVLLHLESKQLTEVFENFSPTVIKNLSDFLKIYFHIHHNNPWQSETVFDAFKNTLPGINEIRINELKNFLLPLPPNMCRALFEAIKLKKIKIIAAIVDFEDILCDPNLDTTQCAVVCEVFKDELLGMINSSIDFLKTLRDIDSDNRTIVYSVCKNKLPTIISTVDDLANVLFMLNSEQCKEVCEAVIGNEPSKRLVNNIDDAKNLFRDLDEKQRDSVYGALKNQNALPVLEELVPVVLPTSLCVEAAPLSQAFGDDEQNSTQDAKRRLSPAFFSTRPPISGDDRVLGYPAILESSDSDDDFDDDFDLPHV